MQVSRRWFGPARGLLDDHMNWPYQRSDGTWRCSVIELWAEADFEDGTNLTFRVFANVNDGAEGCRVDCVAIRPLDFVPYWQERAGLPGKA